MAETTVGVIAAAMIQDRLASEAGWLEKHIATAPESLRPALAEMIAARKAAAVDLDKRMLAATVTVPEEIAKLAPVEDKPIAEEPIKR